MIENPLTDADWRILQCISQGISNKDIAVALRKSEYTIRASKQALANGYGLILSEPADAQDAGWMYAYYSGSSVQTIRAITESVN